MPQAIITRAQWGALPAATRNLEPVTWPRGCDLIVHHSDGPTPPAGNLERQDAGAVRAVDAFHYYTRRWRGGIGYNYAVLPSGRIFEGRGHHVGAHTLGYNDLPAVCIIGDYSRARPSDAAWAAVYELRARISAGRVRGHRDYLATSCPGDAAYATVVLGGAPPHVRPAAPPHGGTLRLALPASDAYRRHHARTGRPWAGWAECRGPLEWIARHGLEDPDAVLTWRGTPFRGARRARGAAAHIVRTYLAG